MASSTGQRDHVLPLAGFLVGVGPGEPEDVGEEPLGEAVTAHDPLSEALAGRW